MKTIRDLENDLSSLLSARSLRKLVLSKPRDKSVLRAEGHLFEKNGQVTFQLETFTADGKAYHRNLTPEEAPRAIVRAFEEGYGQMNVLTPDGAGEAKISSSGSFFYRGKYGSTAAAIEAHDHKKAYVLEEGVAYDFLVALDICAPDGRIYDKRRAKFLQINKFLENVEAICPALPEEGELFVLDLCCGKSYLTFAVYHYLTQIKGRRVKMLGADLKKDVIGYCASQAEKLGYTGLSFVCCDIGTLSLPARPNLVLSLHACDIATDIVLAKAIVSEADVILSTPCCHHEAMGQVTKGESEMKTALSPITDQSLLRQKLCDALTDGLRCRMLEAEGYRVSVVELIDPEQTPKNLLIRAIKGSISPEEKEKRLAEYDEVCRFAGVRPFLKKILAAYRTKADTPANGSERD